MGLRGPKPGTKRVGGVKKGTRHKNKVELSERVAKILGDHPVDALAKVAKEAIVNGDVNMAVSALKEVCKYVSPQLKAVEHQGAIDLTATVTKITRRIVDADGNRNSDT